MGNTGMEKFSCRRKLRRLGALLIARARTERGKTCGGEITGHEALMKV